MDVIANARMYAVTPGATAAWRRLFEAVGRRSGVNLAYVEHAAPAPLEQLWARGDLGAVFMCGWPFACHPAPRPCLVAAPVPAPARYGGRPVYMTDLVVRADRGFARLEDTFGGRLAWTVGHSQSGFNALRHFLAPWRRRRGAPLFATTVGPLVTPRRVIDAIVSGEADIGPLDAYWHDLLKRHEPATAAQLRVIATTDPAPIPPLVASPDLDPESLARLRAAFLGAPALEGWDALAAELLLRGFEMPDRTAYEVTRAWASADRDVVEPGWPVDPSAEAN
jgi:ABC-type phosphate/phosphonate transport system substrate-binding protein